MFADSFINGACFLGVNRVIINGCRDSNISGALNCSGNFMADALVGGQIFDHSILEAVVLTIMLIRIAIPTITDANFPLTSNAVRVIK